MANTNNNNTGSGVGFLGLLAILFIGLKLGGVITWSWWWVLSPLWGPLAILLVVILSSAFIAGLVAGTRAVKGEKQRRKNKLN